MRHHRNSTVLSKNDVHTCSEKLALSQAPDIWVNERGLDYAPTVNICTSKAPRKKTIIKRNKDNSLQKVLYLEQKTNKNTQLLLSVKIVYMHGNKALCV
jgi:hypothetical protein